MYLRDYLIILVFIGIFVGGSALIIGDLSNSYSVPADTSFNKTFNKINNVVNLTEDIKEGIGSKTDVGFIGILDVVISGAWKSVKLMVSSISIFNDLTKDLGNILNIPTLFITAFALLIVIGIIFGIISTAFRRKV
jgi:hypothetical protein